MDTRYNQYFGYMMIYVIFWILEQTDISKYHVNGIIDIQWYIFPIIDI